MISGDNQWLLAPLNRARPLSQCIRLTCGECSARSNVWVTISICCSRRSVDARVIGQIRMGASRPKLARRSSRRYNASAGQEPGAPVAVETPIGAYPLLDYLSAVQSRSGAGLQQLARYLVW